MNRHNWLKSAAIIFLIIIFLRPNYLIANVEQQKLKQSEYLDAQQQQRQRQMQQQAERSHKTEDIHFTSPQYAELVLPKESLCFPIHHISIKDYLSNSSKSLFDWAYQQAKDKLALNLPHCFGSESINLFMETMQNLIIERGYVTTRVVMAEQDLASGKLDFIVIPGRLRQILVEDRGEIAKFTKLTALSAMTMQSGDLLNVRDIEQSLENLKAVPTVNTAINIKPSNDPEDIGKSDLLIQYEQNFPLRLSLGLNDAGSKSTGRWQGSATLSMDNILSLNDLFYVGVTQSLKRPDWLGQDEYGPRRSQNINLYYSFPWRYWQLTFSHNKHRYYQQVAAAYGSTVMYAGRSENSKLTLSRVIYRDERHKTKLSASLWTKKSSNFIDDQEVLVQRKRTGGWEIGLQHKSYFNTASLEIELTFKRGTGLNRARAYSEEKYNEGTSRMKILTANLSFTQPFSLFEQKFVYQTSWQAQWNKTPLILQDQFSIGGRYSVRGTDGELTLSGERGWLWRNELAWFMANSAQQLYISLDKGKVSGESTKNLLGTSLIGSSLGIRGGWRWFNYDLFVGKPIHVPQGFRTKNTVVGFNLSANF